MHPQCHESELRPRASGAYRLSPVISWVKFTPRRRCQCLPASNATYAVLEMRCGRTPSSTAATRSTTGKTFLLIFEHATQCVLSALSGFGDGGRSSRNRCCLW